MSDATPKTLSVLTARRALRRIEGEIERILEEGIASPGLWYAMDRFQAIACIAAAAAEGSDDAPWADADREQIDYFKTVLPAERLDAEKLLADGEPVRPADSA
jgi:hypothetical protein